MAAILGLDPYKTAYDVWVDKVYDTKPINSKPMDAGTKFESGVLDFATEQLGHLAVNQTRYAEGLPIVSNIDAIRTEGDLADVECKTAGLFGPIHQRWGKAGTDEVPSDKIIQCQTHMLCDNKDLCYLAAFLGDGRGFVMYKIARNDKIIQRISEECTKFWNENVLTKIAPSGSLYTPDTFEKIKRVPKKTTEISGDLIEKYLQINKKCSMLNKMKTQARADILKSMGDAEFANSDKGTVDYTGRFNVKGLQNG